MLIPAALLLVAAACGGPAEQETAADWATEVETRLVDESVDQTVVDCVLNVARVELGRNPLSEAATDELVTNCERARAVLDGDTDAVEPSTELAMTDQPFTFGDDPTLDALWAACEEGSGRSCDQLFAAAPLDSEYEEFGVTCGRRPELLHCGELDAESDE
ncbi:MAG: hypothetical protein AAGA65_04730 [Actinomycetota bacterium]